MDRSRAWVFVLNNYTPAEDTYCQNLGQSEKVRFIIFGREQAPGTGTPHLQGYIYMKNPHRLTGMKKIFPRAHLEKAAGTPEDNIRYSSKDGNVFRAGEVPTQGKRTDLAAMKQKVKEGATMRDLIDISVNYQDLRTAELLMKYAPPIERQKPAVYWFYGETGTGKTRRAVEMGGDDYWISGKDLKWWDGYYGQKTVILDDFRGDFCPLHELLRILDRYPYRVELKGSSAWLRAETIIITAPLPPESYYLKAEQAAMEQLNRRITSVTKFEKPSGIYEDPFAGLQTEISTDVAIYGTEVQGNTKPGLLYAQRRRKHQPRKPRCPEWKIDRAERIDWGECGETKLSDSETEMEIEDSPGDWC